MVVFDGMKFSFTVLIQSKYRINNERSSIMHKEAFEAQIKLSLTTFLMLTYSDKREIPILAMLVSIVSINRHATDMKMHSFSA